MVNDISFFVTPCCRVATADCPLTKTVEPEEGEFEALGNLSQLAGERIKCKSCDKIYGWHQLREQFEFHFTCEGCGQKCWFAVDDPKEHEGREEFLRCDRCSTFGDGG